MYHLSMHIHSLSSAMRLQWNASGLRSHLTAWSVLKDYTVCLQKHRFINLMHLYIHNVATQYFGGLFRCPNLIFWISPLIEHFTTFFLMSILWHILTQNEHLKTQFPPNMQILKGHQANSKVVWKTNCSIMLFSVNHENRNIIIYYGWRTVSGLKKDVCFLLLLQKNMGQSWSVHFFVFFYSLEPEGHWMFFPDKINLRQ